MPSPRPGSRSRTRTLAGGATPPRRWPGRLELLRAGDRDVLLDGAHNPAGAAALALALDDLRPVLDGGSDAVPPPLTLVVASMADKDVDGVIAGLLGTSALRGARVVATSIDGPAGAPRGGPGRPLARARRPGRDPRRPGRPGRRRGHRPGDLGGARSGRRRRLAVPCRGSRAAGSSTTRGCATRRTTANERRPGSRPRQRPSPARGARRPRRASGPRRRPEHARVRPAGRRPERPAGRSRRPRRSGGGRSPGAPGRS